MKTIVVTGATSFIGTYLVEALSKKAYQVYAVVRPHSQNRYRLPVAENVVPITLEMCDYHLLDHFLPRADVMILLAWDGVRGESRNDALRQLRNYHANIKAIHAAIRTGCQTVINAGSQAEYGPHSSLINEETPCYPNTAYGTEKLRFYQDAFDICQYQQIDFKEPRFFSLYGVGDFQDSLIISLIKKLIQGVPSELSDCTQKWDFLHVSDAVNAVLGLIETPCVNGAYNVASGISRPLKQFVEEIYRITGSTAELTFGGVAQPATGKVEIDADITKLRQEIGFIPQIKFQAGIAEIIDWLRLEIAGEK